MTYSVQKIHDTAAAVLRDGAQVAVVSVAGGDVVATVANEGVPLLQITEAFALLAESQPPKAQPAAPEPPHQAQPEPQHAEEIS
jgi:hypothetical protein